MSHKLPGLQLGPLSRRTTHLCIDMQQLFGANGPWHAPWMDRVLPVVERIVASAPHRTIFTRFWPPERPEQRPGEWIRYFVRWAEVTRERVDPRLLELFPGLAAHVPPARVVDKPAYSPFHDSALDQVLHERQIDTVVVTGAETDQCVLAAVLGAVDRGLRTVVVADAVCSSSDDSHDDMLELFARRYNCQIEVASAADIVMQLQDLGPN